MFGRLASIPWQSIRVKLVLGHLCITIPLIALLIYNNTHSINVIHNQVATTNKKMIAIHMKQIDEQLSEVERLLMGLTLSEPNVLMMGERVADDEYTMAKSAVSRRLNSDLIVSPYIDGFFVYSLPRQDMVEVTKYTMKYKELSSLREAVEQHVLRLSEQPTHMNAEWIVQQIQGKPYIVRLFRSDDLFIGAWIKSETMLNPLRGLHGSDDSSVLIVDGDGEPLASTRSIVDEGLDFSLGFENYYLTGRDNDYLVVGESSQKGSFSLVSVVPDKQILENLPYLVMISKIMIAAALLMLLFSVWFFRRVLLLPLRKIMLAMRSIGQGNFNQLMDESHVSDEFQMVNRTFNHMIKQIEELKIHVYEEQLEKQRAELKHLQLQINPHFFMNSLNILYNLAQVQQYKLIQEMTMCLSQYFRYMSQSKPPLVPLRDELQHVQNYLRIQEMRLPGRLRSTVQVPAYLEDTPIPPMLLQTFVENTMKHAVMPEGSITLTIEATLDTQREEPMVCVIVRDTGEGFSDKALAGLHSGKPIVDDKGEHIGLWNARERLRLQFGDKAWMNLYNDAPQGAVVELMIPLYINPNSGRDNDA